MNWPVIIDHFHLYFRGNPRLFLAPGRVNLVNLDAVTNFRKTIRENYRRETGLTPEIYISAPAAGARKINLKTVECRS